LLPDEFRRLVQSALESNKVIRCFDGLTRAGLYVLAMLTGLRRGELGELTPSSFNLNANPPTVTIEATVSLCTVRPVFSPRNLARFSYEQRAFMPPSACNFFS
jgi:integrase